ncbi:hypothetical protein Y032_0274g1024 [Ancylostoma ceylanicum]|uniref:Uncharacterized protein n=1 Tax=Ancylostoma ceylanicum TaxID=53326 RepID=A0A016S8D3_9BILA|nr:hypothetical protein Y032_0274g1024 [Ancylostoma ceylanicum]
MTSTGFLVPRPNLQITQRLHSLSLIHSGSILRLIFSFSWIFNNLRTAVDKRRDRVAGTVVVFCTSRDSGKSQRIGFPPYLCPAGSLPRRSRQPECPRRGPVRSSLYTDSVTSSS